MADRKWCVAKVDDGEALISDQENLLAAAIDGHGSNRICYSFREAKTQSRCAMLYIDDIYIVGIGPIVEAACVIEGGVLEGTVLVGAVVVINCRACARIED